MKRKYGFITTAFSLLLIGLLTLVSGCKSEEKEQVPLKVMTFNIRMANPNDSLNYWNNRTGGVGAFLKEQAPDLIGAQEVLKEQLDDLVEMLPNYSYLGVGRLDGKEAGEYSPIFYNNDRVELIEGGYFWLSETPDVPGSVGWDAACERIATWGLFKDLVADDTFFMLNTHFDHVGDTARINSATMIQQEVSKWVDKYPVVVTGDFNLAPPTDPIVKLTNPDEEGFLYDSFETAEVREGEPWTFHDFGRRPMEIRRRIDYIFYQGNWKPTKHITFTEEDRPGHVYLSDHCPVMVEMVRE